MHGSLTLIYKISFHIFKELGQVSEGEPTVDDFLDRVGKIAS
jgi:hypothetical protein